MSPSLVEEADGLVDSFAAVLDQLSPVTRAGIEPEEAKALLITAYIQRSELSFGRSPFHPLRTRFTPRRVHPLLKLCSLENT